MREILFRGKRTDNGEWAEGLLWKKKYNDNRLFISCFPDKDDNEEVFVIYPQSVGQYTGLTDRNGKKIFEGDIIRYTRTNMYAPSYDFHKKDLVSLHLVLWDSSVSAFVQRHYTWEEKRIIGKGSAVLYDDRAKENIVEVIGNIHDNPELLTGEGGINKNG